MGMTDDDQKLYDRFSSMKNALRTPSQGKIVLIGDIVLDRYIHGLVQNLNSRAPVPVLRETSREEDAGAAAHVARGLASMGFDTRLFGFVGDDETGEIILKSLEDAQLSTEDTIVIEEYTTTVKTRLLGSRKSLIGDEQLMLRWDIENENSVPDNALVELYSKIEQSLEGASSLIISDYGLGVVTDDETKKIIQQANKLNVPIIADPKLTGLHRTQNVGWVLFQQQGMELMRRRLGEDSDEGTAKNLIDEYNWGHLVVVSGIDGVTIYSKGQEPVHAPCTLTEVRQLIGLLDAAAVAIAIALHQNFDVEDTALLINATCESILSAEEMRNFIITKDELFHRIGEHAWNLQVSKR